MMLEVEDLHVAYGQVSAVRGISLTVGAGEVVSLLGANGAGKSSTLLAIAGAIRPRSGAVRFDGQAITGWRADRVARLGVSLVPEGRHVFTRLTTRENLRLAMGGKQDRATVAAGLDEAVALFPPLEKLLDREAGALSGGEQQMLAIGRALLTRPRLLILDEPSLGLAPVIVDVVFAAIERLRGDGMTILLVEQNASRALALCDRAYLMATGEVVQQGTPDALGDAAELADVYLGTESA